MNNRTEYQRFHNSGVVRGEPILESIGHGCVAASLEPESPSARIDRSRHVGNTLRMFAAGLPAAQSAQFGSIAKLRRSDAGASLPGAEPGVLYDVLKRIGDLAVASIGLVLLFPVMMIIAAAIYVEDRGPLVYFQMRIGKDGRAFRFYKFRSMVRDADSKKGGLAAVNEANGPIFKIKEDPRVTRVGKFIRRYSLDELPQLANVLRGDMAIIGPRPLYAPEAESCTPLQWRRHSVQSGLLCFREVSGRSQLSFERWMELDLVYVETRSMRTDLGILLRAIPAILRSEGAY